MRNIAIDRSVNRKHLFSSTYFDRNIVVVICACGALSSIIMFYGLFSMGFLGSDGIYDVLKSRMAQENLNSLAKTIELYRSSHGSYPASLAVLKSSLARDSFETLIFIDPRDLKAKGDEPFFYYRRVGADHYYLRGLAPDGKPFSAGALVPNVGIKELNSGLLIEPPPETPRPQ
jgi:hypothetical protein